MVAADFKPEDASFLAGSWTAEIWGGVFEEVWLAPKADSIIGLGRHSAEGKTTFMENATIQKSKDGAWTLYITLGLDGASSKTPIAFKLQEFVAGKSVTFANLKNEYPTHVAYTNVSKDKMKCVISGRADGKEASDTFNFVRVKQK